MNQKTLTTNQHEIDPKKGHETRRPAKAGTPSYSKQIIKEPDTNVSRPVIIVSCVSRLIAYGRAAYQHKPVCDQTGKNARIVFAKELLIHAGRRAGATIKTLSKLTGLDPSTVSRRHDKGKLRMGENPEPERC